ncbi:MAG: tryptophan-rich sensory protein [Candidatus Zambryskibacteria bacterium]|nr:tryptophan-rich sensory protein [Candidatus Zambryskibacteria bacterium]
MGTPGSSNRLSIPHHGYSDRSGRHCLRLWVLRPSLFGPPTLKLRRIKRKGLRSIIFFGSTSLTINGLNNIGIALVDIIFLWLAILATIVAFYKISKSAAWLLAPYLLWVSFAAYLNYSIYVLN